MNDIDTTHDIPQAAEHDHHRQDFRRPRCSEHLLEEQRTDKLSSFPHLRLRDRSNIRDVRQHEQRGDESQGDRAAVLDGADGVGAAHLGEDVECVVPSDVREVRLDERGGEGVSVVRASGPRVSKVCEGLGDAVSPSRTARPTATTLSLKRKRLAISKSETGVTILEKRL